MLRLIAYGWVEPLFVRPAFRFKYWGFDWVEPLSGSLTHSLCYVLAALALGVAFGLCSRIATLTFTLGFAYLQLTDAANYLNHYYLAGLFGLLLSAAPAHRAWSIDARLRPAARVTQIPAIWLYVFRLQVGAVYTYAALAKLDVDWLVHGQPLRIWLTARGELPVIGTWLSEPFVAVALSWAGFLFDLSVPWLLLSPRARPFAFGVVIVFHGVTGCLFPIGMFPWLMLGAALVFFPPDWPRLLARPLVGAAAGSCGLGLRAPPPSLAMRAGLFAYCFAQLLVPLRGLAYGGDVNWHEQGSRFSWRVMVHEKSGVVSYRVHSAGLNRTWTVEPSRYLTPRQARELAGRPDLILQLAHHIAREFSAQTHGRVEVRADALATLNGRANQPLIDPTVDLANVRDDLAPASWILPR
jgi:hypothetical protein